MRMSALLGTVLTIRGNHMAQWRNFNRRRPLVLGINKAVGCNPCHSSVSPSADSMGIFCMSFLFGWLFSLSTQVLQTVQNARTHLGNLQSTEILSHPLYWEISGCPTGPAKSCVLRERLAQYDVAVFAKPSVCNQCQGISGDLWLRSSRDVVCFPGGALSSILVGIMNHRITEW